MIPDLTRRSDDNSQTQTQSHNPPSPPNALYSTFSFDLSINLHARRYVFPGSVIPSFILSSQIERPSSFVVNVTLAATFLSGFHIGIVMIISAQRLNSIRSRGGAVGASSVLPTSDRRPYFPEQHMSTDNVRSKAQVCHNLCLCYSFF